MDYALRDYLKGQVLKNDRKTLDVLHAVTQSDPKTHKFTQESMSRVLRPANLMMAEAVRAIGYTLNDPSSFAAYRNPGTDVGSVGRTVKVSHKGGPRSPLPMSAQQLSWPHLKYSYLRRIGFSVRKSNGRYVVSGGSRTGGTKTLPEQGPKRYWYERRRRGSRIKGGVPIGTAAVYDMEQLYTAILSASRGPVYSPFGEENRFTISENARRRQATSYSYTRKTRKGKTVVEVYSVKGDVQYPAFFSVKDLKREFAEVLLDSMSEKRAVAPGSTPKELFARARDTNNKNWLVVTLANEYRRPWIGRYFSTLEPLLIRYMQEGLLEALR